MTKADLILTLVWGVTFGILGMVGSYKLGGWWGLAAYWGIVVAVRIEGKITQSKP